MTDALMTTYNRLPVSLVRGSGARVWDDTGREYLDALAGIAVCGLGHAHPDVADAIAEQARTLVHVSNNYRIPAQEELGARLTALSGHQRAFFCNSGTEANEAAIKIARRYAHDRGIAEPRIAVCEHAFHGRTLGALTATGNENIRAGFGPLVPGFERVPYGDLDALRSLGDRVDGLVAVMIEPVQGEGGVRPLPEGRLAELRALCDERGWLLICDEIQTGMGRTGRWFAQEHEAVHADVTTIAKALGNGFPIGCCLARGSAAETLVPGSHGTTFGGNPLACRTGLAVLGVIEREGLVERAGDLGARMLSGFRERLGALEGVRDIRGKGMMFGIELARDCGELVRRALDAGLLINVTAGSSIRLLPPLVISDDEAERIVDGVSDLVRDFLAEG